MKTLPPTGLSFAPIIHLTDLHLTTPQALLHGAVDTWARLEHALEVAARMRPAALIISGDLVDRPAGGDPRQAHHVYDLLAQRLEEFTDETEAPVICTPGNHDPELSMTWTNPDAASTGPCSGDSIHFVRGLRVIGLNTHGFGVPAGRLEPGQLRWLTAELKTDAPEGTILVMHHPPFASMVPAMAGRGLVFPGNLAHALEGSDVTGVLCGHYHSGEHGQLEGIPVWSNPSLSFNYSLLAEPGTSLESTWGAMSILHPTRATISTVTLDPGVELRSTSDGTLDGFSMQARAGR